MSSDNDESLDSGYQSATPRQVRNEVSHESGRVYGVWKYFERCEAPPGRHDTTRIYRRCKFCKAYRTDHATRAKTHLMGNIVKGDAPACLKLYDYVDMDEINRMYAVIKVPPSLKYKRADGSHILRDVKGRRVDLRTSNSQASTRDSNYVQSEHNTSTVDLSRSSNIPNPIINAYQIPNRSRLDKLWAKAFYTSGIAFNVAENPYFREAVIETSKGSVNGYSLPSMHHLRFKLLEECVADVDTDIHKVMKEAKPFGYSLSSDGWENVRREPLMNVMLLTCKGDFFLDSWNAAQADKKDGKYLGDMWVKYIEEVGANQVVQIVTDGAPANRVAGCEIVMKKYPHVTWSWCAAHVFNLLLEDMCGHKKVVIDASGQNPFKKIFKRLRWIVKAVSSSQKLSAIFVRKSALKKLLNPNATRFATNFLMAQRALELRGPLQEMVIDDKWQSYRERLPVQPRTDGHMTRGKAEELKQWIQQDAFWAQVKETVNFFLPLVKMLREFDGASPQSGWLFWSLKNGIVDLKTNMDKCSLVTEYLKPRILQVYMERKKSLTTDFMLAAAYMNPHMFFDEDQDVAGDADLSRGFNEYLCRYAENVVPEGTNHAGNVNTLISTIQLQAFEAQKKLPHTSVAIRGAQSNIDKFSPAEWWHAFGADYTDLRLMARKILHQKVCASACERNWSAYGYIHSKSRNRLTNDRAKDLVFVFTNMRVQKGLTNVRNPHTFIYKRYDQRRSTNDQPMRLSSDAVENEENDATCAALGEQDVDNCDTIDDADEALQGLSLHSECLTRIPPDTEVNDEEEWDNETDLQMYPTIDESQIQDEGVAFFDPSFEMSSQPHLSFGYPRFHSHNDLDASTSIFRQQPNNIETIRRDEIRLGSFHEHNNLQRQSVNTTRVQWPQHASQPINAYGGPSSANLFTSNMSLGLDGLQRTQSEEAGASNVHKHGRDPIPWMQRPPEWIEQYVQNQNNNTRDFLSQP